MRDSNLVLLSEIKREQAETDDNYVNDTVLGNAARIVFHLDYQPEIFRTFHNSIQMQFETDDMSYLEFEVFENRMTCMLVPQRDYDRATFPTVSLENTDLMNHIVRELYGVA